MVDLKKEQIDSLKRILEIALNYHFNNYVKLEAQCRPVYSPEGHKPTVTVEESLRARNHIKLEYQAYIIHLRRVNHFIYNLGERISEPTEEKFKQIWYDIRDEEGVVNLLANKWAAHRSVDWPKTEKEWEQMEVLENLESQKLFWKGDHVYIAIKGKELSLFSYHGQALSFIKWLFENIKDQNEKN
jgi:hypothetical protein